MTSGVEVSRAHVLLEPTPVLAELTPGEDGGTPREQPVEPTIDPDDPGPTDADFPDWLGPFAVSEEAYDIDDARYLYGGFARQLVYPARPKPIAENE